MKTLTTKFLKNFTALLLLNLTTIALYAQDSASTSSTTTRASTKTITTEEIWYMQPWVMILGVVVVLLILISLFKSKSPAKTTDSVTYSKTVKRDDDI